MAKANDAKVSQDNNAMLSLNGVSKNFGGIVANRGISLEVPAGGIIGLIGPNGSGKSTLFNVICGTHLADAGQVKFCGRNITADSTAAIARAGLIRVFQQTRVYKEMKCIDNMRISAPVEGGWFSPPPESARAEAMDLLDFVGLAEKNNWLAGELSFGQQKLLELAMALIAKPKLLLLDEPTAGINPTLINGVMSRLRAVNEEFGVTLFVIEHNMRVIMNLAQRIFCLARGEVLAVGAPGQIQNDERVIDAYLGG
ncbi:MAG: ABC transporter ATP-binding protein [Gammaproteobacteria bacterium]